MWSCVKCYLRTTIQCTISVSVHLSQDSHVYSEEVASERVEYLSGRIALGGAKI